MFTISLWAILKQQVTSVFESGCNLYLSRQQQ